MIYHSSSSSSRIIIIIFIFIIFILISISRKFVKDYVPSLQVDNPSLVAYLQNHGIYSEKYVSIDKQLESCKRDASEYLSKISSSERMNSSIYSWSRDLKYIVINSLHKMSCLAVQYRPTIEYLITNFCYYFANFTAIAVTFLSYLFVYMKE